MILRAILTLLFAASAVLPHVTAAQDTSVDLNDPAQIEAGHATFNTNCTGYCHGKDGIVGRGPSLRGRSDLSADRIHSTILNGKRDVGKIMPAWKGQLDDQTVWQLTAFILSLRNVP